MIVKKNYYLSPHFTLKEYIEGTAMPKKGQNMAWKYLTDKHEKAIKDFIHILEDIRYSANLHFTSDKDTNREIGVVITAGYRPIEWEKLQGRSGNSQHTICAVDFKFSNVSNELNAHILKTIYDDYNEHWMGGLAIKYPTLNNKGEVEAVGFIHIDPRKPTQEHIDRGYGARWFYNVIT